MNINKDFGDCYDETILFSTQKSSRVNTPVKNKKKLITYNSSDSDGSFDRAEFNNINDAIDNDSTVSNSNLLIPTEEAGKDTENKIKIPSDLELKHRHTFNFTP